MPTIGCDPELVLLEDPPLSRIPVIPAQELFGDMNLDLDDKGGIGRDGARILAEIRPAPSTNPEDVVGNICHLLKRIVDVGRNQIRLAVGTYRETVGGIGGHLHVWGREATRKKILSPSGQEVICLGVSWLWRLEDYEGGVKRRSSGYGKILDVRNSNCSKEFRSPSADWMAHPTLAKHTLSYFKSIAENADRMFKDVDQRKELLNRAAYYWSPDTLRPPRRDGRERRVVEDDFMAAERAVIERRVGNQGNTPRAVEDMIRQLYGGAQAIQAIEAREAQPPRPAVPVEQIRKDNIREREAYLDEILKEIKKFARSRDLSTIEFFASRIDKLRETDKLIRLDLNKWRVA